MRNAWRVAVVVAAAVGLASGCNLIAGIREGVPLEVLEIATGFFHTCALLSQGEVKCWGYNDYGQLGLGDNAVRGDSPGEMGYALSAVDLSSGRTAKALAAGYYHICALLDDGSVKCWGGNYSGQLGLGDTKHRGTNFGEMGNSLPVVDLGSGKTATALAAGGDHTCALLNDGFMKCWGLNDDGQLGLGDNAVRGDDPDEMGNSLPTVDLGSGKTAKALAAGGSHTCVILNDDSTKCWGHNDFGQLGLGDTAHRGDDPGEMGDALPAVNLVSGKTSAALATGYDHTCAILNDGSTKCWGRNAYGQLGLGDTAHRGDASGEMGDTLPTVSLGNDKTAVALRADGHHTCARFNDGSVKCWGANHYGQLGLGGAANRGDAPGEMSDALPTVKLFSPLW